MRRETPFPRRQATDIRIRKESRVMARQIRNRKKTNRLKAKLKRKHRKARLRVTQGERPYFK